MFSPLGLRPWPSAFFYSGRLRQTRFLCYFGRRVCVGACGALGGCAAYDSLQIRVAHVLHHAKVRGHKPVRHG